VSLAAGKAGVSKDECGSAPPVTIVRRRRINHLTERVNAWGFTGY
jgi:hypothetical protein